MQGYDDDGKMGKAYPTMTLLSNVCDALRRQGGAAVRLLSAGCHRAPAGRAFPFVHCLGNLVYS